MSTPKLNPQDLRAFARRDWSAPERLARRDRAALSLDERLRLQGELFAIAKATRPGWPTPEDRLDDLKNHLRMNALYDRLADAFPR